MTTAQDTAALGWAGEADAAANLALATPVVTAADLHAWVKTHVGVSVPREPMIEGHSAPFDYLIHAYFEGEYPHDAPARLRLPADPLSAAVATSRAHDSCPTPPLPNSPTQSSALRPQSSPSPIDCVVWACRGGGKTYLGAVATALDLLHKPGIEVRIIAGSLEQAGKMYRHLRAIFDPPGLVGLVQGRITSRRIALNNGSALELLAQSEASVRGTRVQRIRCDEVELFEPAIWDAAQLTTRSRADGPRTFRGTIECLSTMHVPQGLMARLVREAREGRRRLFTWSLPDVLERCTGRACHADGRDGARKRMSSDPPWRAGSATERRCDEGANTGAGQAVAPLSHSPRAPAFTRSRAQVSLPLLPGPCPLLPECEGLAKSEVYGAAEAPEPRIPGFITVEDAVRMKARVPRDVWDAEMLCLHARRSDMVFPEFDRALHVVGAAAGEGERGGKGIDGEGDSPGAQPPRPFVPVSLRPFVPSVLLCGMDFGFRAPTVILWALHDGEADRLTIIAERVQAEAVLEAHVRAILESPLGRPAWVGIDPAGNARNGQTGVSAAQVLRRAGLAVRARPFPVHAGLELVRARLRGTAGARATGSAATGFAAGATGFAALGDARAEFSPADPLPPRLVVHASCSGLIEAMETYHYSERDPTSLEPVKDGPDHACDALRYLVTNLDRPCTTRFGNYLR